MVITKMDLLPHVPFDLAAAEENARRINPEIEIIKLSCLSGEGMPEWQRWLQGKVARAGPPRSCRRHWEHVVEIRRRIDVSGIVQGVGFRPYVYRLAKARALGGNVRNTSAGVTIELEGPNESVEKFVAELSEHVPALAHIMDVHQSELPCVGEREFSILESDRTERARAFISPDVAICDDCLRELFDPSNRRYLLSVHQLHELRAALHDCAEYSV